MKKFFKYLAISIVLSFLAIPSFFTSAQGPDHGGPISGENYESMGLGTISLQDADNVGITGGTIDGVTLTNSTLVGNSISNPEWTAANTGTVTLTGFHAANQTQTGNITSINGDNPVIRKIIAYINSDPTADENVTFRLSLYNADEYTEDQLIKDFSFNLTYTETNGGVTATDTTDTVDTSAGLVKYDLIRFLGGTAENQRITATPTATGLTFTAAGQDHADNTGIVKVWEYTDAFQLVDADASNEIHIKLESLAALTASTNIVVYVEYQ